MKSLPAPETSGVVALRRMGSLCVGLGVLVILASLVLLLLSFTGPTTGMREKPMVALLTAFYSIPLLALGLLMRWLAAINGLLSENNRLLRQTAENDPGNQD